METVSEAVVDLTVVVYVNAADEELAFVISESGGMLSLVDVVREEIASNLESVSYVNRACVTNA